MAVAPRERVQIPTHLRSLVTQYVMKDWLKKACPGRQRLLAGVPTVYKEFVVLSVGEAGDTSVEFAETSALEAVAILLARSIDKEQSLVEWIEKNDQSYPSEPEKWLAVCLAAGWLVIQTYFRESVAQRGGE